MLLLGGDTCLCSHTSRTSSYHMHRSSSRPCAQRSARDNQYVHRGAKLMVLVDGNAAGESTSTVATAPADHLFLIVLYDVEMPIYEGTLYGSSGATVTATSLGRRSAAGLRSVLVRGGGEDGTVRFTFYADAAAEGVGTPCFDRCGATRVEQLEVAREVSVYRCRAAEAANEAAALEQDGVAVRGLEAF